MHSRAARLHLLLSVGLVMSLIMSAACGPPPLGDPAVTDCALDSRAQGEGPRTEAELEALLSHVRERLFSDELALADISLSANPERDNESSFLQANLVPATATATALRRHYVVRYAPALLTDPPPASAVAAILAHELRHVADYVQMDTPTLAGFGLGYVLADPAPYERRTDRFVVDLGCARGLKAYRHWNYARLDEGQLAEKRRVYLTPEEIDALVAERAD